MLATEITNHVQQALARLLQQYVGQPRITSVITALVQQVQAIEDAIYSLDAGRQIYGSVGEQLDQLGTLVGLLRNGLSDPEYLIFILGTIAENNSDTTDLSITGIVRFLFQVTTGQIFDLFPAEIGIEIPDTTTLDPSLYNQVASIIIKSLGAGIGLGFIALTPPVAFQFGSITNTNVGGGFGELSDPTQGGGFAGNIYADNDMQDFII